MLEARKPVRCAATPREGPSPRVEVAEGTMDQAIVFVTHIGGERIQRHYLRLQSETLGLLPAYLCVHHTTQSHIATTFLPAHFRVDDSRMKAALPVRFGDMQIRGKGLLPGFMDLIHMAVMLDPELDRYGYIWIIEYDVDFSGTWRCFFSQAMTSSADFLATTIFPRSQTTDFIHWSWFKVPGFLPEKRHLRSFHPIFRFSRRMIHFYKATVEDGTWGGHTESLYPTIAAYRGLQIEDLGGRGPFFPKHASSSYYVNTPRGDLAPGTFVYRPVEHDSYFHEDPSTFRHPDYLYHPVKIRC
jgi:hypothetical protein